jgi:methylmalonyl-CoA/ethylmalonyl-CoA epimerase
MHNPREQAERRTISSVKRCERQGSAMELCQVAQHATDLERATAFYAELLQTQPAAVFDPPGLVFFRLGPVRLLLDRGAPPALIYLQVPDVRAAAERCRAAGVQIVTEPHVIFRHRDDVLGPAGTDEWMTFVRDSEDNVVALVSQEASGSSA